jgi:flagellar basal body-associated protein FliL
MKKRTPMFLLLGLMTLGVLQIAVASSAVAAEAGKTAGDDDDSKKKKNVPEDTSGGRFAGDPIYVHMPPMVLPIISDTGVEQLVTIILDVEVKDFDAADQMHANMPRVQDSLMRSLYGGLGQGSLRHGKLVDVAKVKNKAISSVGEIIGIDNVVDVLIQGVSQRML